MGLRNLGNSCYMNSGLQCLSKISPLTHFLLSDSYEAKVNRLNRDGTNGQLVKEYSDLLRRLWFGSDSVVSPEKFKRALGRANLDYAGLQQVQFLLRYKHIFRSYSTNNSHPD